MVVGAVSSWLLNWALAVLSVGCDLLQGTERAPLAQKEGP